MTQEEYRKAALDAVMELAKDVGIPANFKDIVKKQGMEKYFYIKSSATSSEEIGNDIHYGTRDKLIQKGVPFKKRKAVKLKLEDYNKYNYIIGMDNSNIINIQRIVGEDSDKKIYKLLDFSNNPRDIADPWYTGNFEITFNDIVEGCNGFLKYLKEKEKFDYL